MLRSMRGIVVVFTIAAVAALVGGLVSASSTSLARPQPWISPTVCQTGGTCFEVDNSGHGIAITGSVTANHAKGVLGVSQSTSSGGNGINGQAYGPSSIAINGVAFSTDSSHPSVGVDGESANGNGIRGVTRFNSQLQISAAAGVSGADKSTRYAFDEGVLGTSTLGVGVAGVSNTGNAVTGSSTGSNGVVGQTFFAMTGPGQAGVLGQDLATPNPLGTPVSNSGVAGTSLFGSGVTGVTGGPCCSAGVSGFSNVGLGVLGTTNSGNGVAAIATGSGTGLTATSNTGVALSVANSSSNSNVVQISGPNAPGPGDAVEIFTGGTAISAQGYTAGIDTISYGGSALTATLSLGSINYQPPPVLLVQENIEAPSPPPLIVATKGIGGSAVMSLDQNGNMVIAGTLTQNGSPLIAHRSQNGWGVGTYSAQETQATVEDVGESQITSGEGYVRLDPHFAALLDSRMSYLVFLTPQGDCRGLYATEKSLGGFYVRELQGGRSTITFDYRIVAKPTDSTGDRLPVIKPIGRYGSRAIPSIHHTTIKAPRIQIPRIRTNYVPSH